MGKGIVFSLALFWVLIVPAGAEPAREPAAVTEGGTQQRTLWDDLEINWSSFTYGPAVGLLRPYQPNGDGKRLGPIALVNQVTFASPAFGAMQWEMTSNFSIQPWENSPFVVKNPSLGLQGDVIPPGGEFSYWARYEAALSFNEESLREGSLITPQATNILAYRAKGSKFLFRSVIMPQLSLYSDGTTRPALYVSPQVFYLLTENFRLLLIGEAAWMRNMKQSSFKIIEDYPPTVGLGFRYIGASGRYWIQPFINVFPFGRFASDTIHPALVLNVQLK